jgi:hypothetical protein
MLQECLQACFAMAPFLSVPTADPTAVGRIDARLSGQFPE